MRTLTRADLDHMECMVPGCTTPHPHPLFVRSACHPMNRTASVAYDPTRGEIVVRCATCDAVVVRVAVAAERWRADALTQAHT